MKKIVIEIPDETYNECLADEGRLNIIWELVDAIRKGTPLPKGHGRILDEKEILDTEKHDGGWYDLVDLPEYIAGVSAIVEADKGEQE